MALESLMVIERMNDDLTVLQCESTIPSVSAALSSVLRVPVSDF